MATRRDGWVLLIVLALIWGSSFILMKRGLFDHGRPVLGPWQVACLRLSIAWLALSPVLFGSWVHLRGHWKALLASGLFGNGIPAILFTTAQSRIGSALAGMINSLAPLFVLIIGVLFFGTLLRWVHVIGVLLGLAGAVGLVLVSRSVEGAPAFYAGCAVLATVGYGLSANIVKRYLQGVPPAAISSLALTFVGVPAAILVFVTKVPHTLVDDPSGWRAVGYVAVLATMGSALALVLWNRLIQITSALAASTVTYLMPVVAIGWGLFDGETVDRRHLAMIAAILAGVLLVNLADRRSA